MENTYTILAEFTLYPRLEILVILRDVERVAFKILNLCSMNDWSNNQQMKSVEDIQLSGDKHMQT